MDKKNKGKTCSDYEIGANYWQIAAKLHGLAKNVCQQLTFLYNQHKKMPSVVTDPLDDGKNFV